MSRKLPPQELARLRRMARELGGALLSRAILGTTVKLRFRCAAGHEWAQSARTLEQGRWCIACSKARKNQKVKSEAYARLRRIVARHGGTTLSPAYERSLKAMRFRCADGHEFRKDPKYVLRGNWCPECARSPHDQRSARRNQKLYREFLAIVKKRGGEMLRPGYVAHSATIQLRCAVGHEWQTKPQRILSELWCPSCKREALLTQMQEIARERGGVCLSRGCKSKADILEWRCANGHRFRMSGGGLYFGTWCARCRTNARGDIEKLRQIARDRGGLCLSPTYLGAKTKHRWRCKDGHVWTAQPGPVLQGSWCPICSLRGRRTRGLSIADMRQTAMERGGACLSKKYQGALVRLRWRCAQRHTWDALPWQVRQGRWCPVCSHRVPGTLDGMRMLASEHSGKCLTRTWTDHSRPVQFECARGHRFGLLAVVAKTGTWCTVCRAGAGGRAGRAVTGSRTGEPFASRPIRVVRG